MNIPAAIEEVCPDGLKYAQHLEEAALRWSITKPLRAAHWLAQMAHESGEFSRITENLNYSTEGLMKTWPSRFPTLDVAQAYARKPTKIANHVYGGRMGNADEASGDGARYIGRGLLQLTGRTNYADASRAIFGDDRLIDYPELVLADDVAALTAGWFWDSRHLNVLADHDDVAGITRRINGGMHGLDKRKTWTARFLGALT